MDANDMKRAEDFLAHYGVKGMKWGIINEDDPKKIRIGASTAWENAKKAAQKNKEKLTGSSNSKSVEIPKRSGGHTDLVKNTDEIPVKTDDVSESAKKKQQEEFEKSVREGDKRIAEEAEKKAAEMQSQLMRDILTKTAADNESKAKQEEIDKKIEEFNKNQSQLMRDILIKTAADNESKAKQEEIDKKIKEFNDNQMDLMRNLLINTAAKNEEDKKKAEAAAEAERKYKANHDNPDDIAAEANQKAADKAKADKEAEDAAIQKQIEDATKAQAAKVQAEQAMREFFDKAIAEGKKKEAEKAMRDFFDKAIADSKKEEAEKAMREFFDKAIADKQKENAIKAESEKLMTEARRQQAEKVAADAARDRQMAELLDSKKQKQADRQAAEDKKREAAEKQKKAEEEQKDRQMAELLDSKKQKQADRQAAEDKKREAAEKQKKMDDLLVSKKQKQEDRQAAEDAKKKAWTDALNRDRNEFESQVKNMSPDVQKEYSRMSPAERDIFVRQYGANAANMLNRRVSERDAARNSASISNNSESSYNDKKNNYGNAITSSETYNFVTEVRAKETIKNMLRDQRDTESAYKVWDSISDERKDKYIKKYGMEKGIQKLLSGDLDISDSLSDLLDKIKNKETKAQKKGEKKASSVRKKFNNWVLKQDAFDDDPIVGDAMTVDILDEYMAHWGILGQKWGFRRYQNPDGTLTEEGKKRYSSKSMRESTYRNRRNLTDEDLENLTKRLEAEKKFRSLNDEDTHKGRDFMTDMMKRVGVIAIPAIGLAAAGAAVVAGSKTGQEHLRTKNLEGFIGKKDRFVYDGPSGSGNLTGGQFFGRQYLDSVAGMFDRFFKMDKKK